MPSYDLLVAYLEGIREGDGYILTTVEQYSRTVQGQLQDYEHYVLASQQNYVVLVEVYTFRAATS